MLNLFIILKTIIICLTIATVYAGEHPKTVVRNVLPGERVILTYRAKSKLNQGLVWKQKDSQGQWMIIKIAKSIPNEPKKFPLVIEKAIKSTKVEYGIFLEDTMLSNWTLNVADVISLRKKVQRNKNFILSFGLRKNIEGYFVWRKHELNGQHKDYHQNQKDFVERADKKITFSVSIASESFITNYTLLLNGEPVATWNLWTHVRFEKIQVPLNATIYLKYIDFTESKSNYSWERSSVGQRPYILKNNSKFNIENDGHVSTLAIQRFEDVMQGNFHVIKDGKIARIWYLNLTDKPACKVTVYEDEQGGQKLEYMGFVEYYNLSSAVINIGPTNNNQQCNPTILIQTEAMTDIYIDSIPRTEVVLAQDGEIMSSTDTITSNGLQAKLEIIKKNNIYVYKVVGSTSNDTEIKITIIQKLLNPFSISYSY